MNMPRERDNTTEDLLAVQADLPPGLPINSIHCLMLRSQAVLAMLMTQFEEADHGTRCTDDTIINVLWSLMGDFELLRKLVDHAWESQQKLNKESRHG